MWNVNAGGAGWKLHVDDVIKMKSIWFLVDTNLETISVAFVTKLVKKNYAC